MGDRDRDLPSFHALHAVVGRRVGQDGADLARQARTIGYEDLLGELDGGLDAWRGAGEPVASIPTAPAEAATGAVVDVRQHGEFTAGHLPGARNVELGALADTDRNAAAPIAVMGGHGERAPTAASLLVRAGRHDLTVLAGGPGDWARDHGALTTGP